MYVVKGNRTLFFFLKMGMVSFTGGVFTVNEKTVPQSVLTMARLKLTNKWFNQNPNPKPATSHTWSLIGEAMACTKSGIENFSDTWMLFAAFSDTSVTAALS